MRCFPLSLVLMTAACGGPTANLPAVKVDPGSVSIIDGVVARKYSTKQEPIALPFVAGQNGNELVLALLRLAEARGADFVSDIELAIVFKWKGMPIECTTRVVFPDDPALRPAAPASAPATQASEGPDGEPTYETEVKDYQPTLVEYLATDLELFCEKKPHQVKVSHPLYESRFDVEFARSRDYMPTVHDVVIVWTDECEKRPLRHSVTRYDYEAKNEFVPVHWEYISRRYAERPLTETAPLCYRVDERELGATPSHHLRATISYRGAVHQRAPLQGIAPGPGVKTGRPADTSSGR